MIIDIVRTMRPRQWTKNFFVLAGLLFTLDMPHPPSDFAKVGLAFLLFCVISGAVYVINDIRDVEQDRRHPLKRNRPIASGRLSVRAAGVVAVLLLAVGLGGAFALDFFFGIITAAYGILQIAYTFSLKHVVLIDVMTIATGFVLRAAAGAAVIHVEISQWLFICTILVALFMALAKRRDELIRLEGDAANHRQSLAHYTVPYIDQLLIVTASTTIMTYALYTFTSKTGQNHPYLMLTVPFVVYGIFRYMMLVNNGEAAGTPEMLLVKDRPLLLTIFLWGLTSALIVAIGGR